MEILVFLLGLGCLVLIAWAIASSTDATAIALVTDAVSGRKLQQQNRHQEPSSLTPPEIQECNSSQPNITAPPTPTAPPRRVVTLRQPPSSTRVQLPKLMDI